MDENFYSELVTNYSISVGMQTAYDYGFVKKYIFNIVHSHDKNRIKVLRRIIHHNQKYAEFIEYIDMLLVFS